MALSAPVTYTVRRVENAPKGSSGFGAFWEDPAWQAADILEVAHARPESSTHRPQTCARMVYSAAGLHGVFEVHDRYVRAAHEGFQSAVWKDSCVEFFARPKAGLGYFNFEMNCGGSLLCTYVTDPVRTPQGLKACTPLPPFLGQSIEIHSTLPKIVDPELTEPVCWELGFFIPFAVFEPYVGKLGEIHGQRWTGNFYKCAEEVSHPHWMAWSPVDELNFHLPRCFGEILFI